MKTRTGFVSNSSSSSFIILVDKELFNKKSVCPCCGKQKKFYFNSKCFVENDGSYGDNRVNCVGFQEYLKDLENEKDWLFCNWGVPEFSELSNSQKTNARREREKAEKECDDKINKIKNIEKQNKDKILLDISISYHDPDSEQYLKDMVRNGKIMIVEKS